MTAFRLRHRILLVLCAVLLPFAALTFLVVEQRLRGEAPRGLNTDLASARESFAEIPTSFAEGTELVDLLFAGDRTHTVEKQGVLPLHLPPRSALLLIDN